MSESLSTRKEAIPNSQHVEDGRDLEIDPEAERALLRKIDFRLIPCVWFMYLLSYVSSSPAIRATGGAARVRHCFESMGFVSGFSDISFYWNDGEVMLTFYNLARQKQCRKCLYCKFYFPHFLRSRETLDDVY